MKTKIIKLKPVERKALKAITDNLTSFEEMMRIGGLGHRRQTEKLWHKLNGMYPQIKDSGTSDASYSLQCGEIKYFVEDREVAKQRGLKESAIRNKDFDNAVKHRELERKAREKAK